ncbi:unnamed protein product [Meloidogyne enterolobii]|uniref:Uncharacterized protein n=1 Tax=Meloidogyne enterolobii TaxID=390850 RepID=A0ACB0YEV8_MELEN
MKFICFLIFLFFNSILWSLINSVKNNSKQKGLTINAENVYSPKDHGMINDEAESSVAPQIQKYKETINPKIQISKKDKAKVDKDEKKLKKQQYDKKNYQKNRENYKENARNWYKMNKEKRQIYCKNNKEKNIEYHRNYFQNNKEKMREYQRKYRQKKRNEKEIPQTDSLKLKNIQSGNEGCSFDNLQIGDCSDKAKLPDFLTGEGNLPQGEEKESNTEEVKTFVDELNQIVVEEPTKLGENVINQINLNEYPFDLNKKPEED